MVAIHRLRAQRGAQRHSWFYHVGDGYHYHKNVAKNGTMYFKCAHYEAGCRGRAVYSRARGFQHTKGHDGCNCDVYYPIIMKLRQRILMRCRRLEFVSFRQIVTEESRRFPRQVKRKVRLSHIRSAMQRVRYSLFPPPPQTLEELTAILQNPRYRLITATEDMEDNLYAASVTADDGSHHIIFMSRRMVRVLRSLRTLFGDGTFKVVPAIDELDDASQVYCIVGNWDHAIIPLCWVLMQRRTISAYEAVFRTIRILAGGTPNLERFISDFEDAVRVALSNLNPGLTLQGCFFHLVRAIIRYAIEELHMYHLLSREPFRRLVMLCCALALLPRRDMYRGYELVLREARQEGLRVYRLLRPFFAYIHRRWVGNRIRRRWMSVYGSFHRTNNTCESQNRMLMNYVRVRHPNIYHFISCLVSMEDNAYADVEALQIGERPNRRRRARAIALDHRLRNLADGLRQAPDNRDDAIMRYLHAAVHTFARAYERAVEEV